MKKGIIKRMYALKGFLRIKFPNVWHKLVTQYQLLIPRSVSIYILPYVENEKIWFMKSKLNNYARASHVMDWILEIELFLKDISFDNIYTNLMFRRAFEGSLKVIGEASIHLIKEIENQYPNISWREIKGFRNIVIHKYFGVDLEFIKYHYNRWNIQTQDSSTKNHQPIRNQIIKWKKQSNFYFSSFL